MSKFIELLVVFLVGSVFAYWCFGGKALLQLNDRLDNITAIVEDISAAMTNRPSSTVYVAPEAAEFF